MKKRFIGFTAALMAVIVCVSVCGCGPIKVGEEIDVKRSQLYIGNYDGGAGSDWLDEIKVRFEEKYKDTEFEPGSGKKGVQLILNKTKNLSGSVLVNNISSQTDEVFFVESVYYHDFVAKKNVLDITDVVTEPLTEFGENKTILSKLYPDYKKYIAVDDNGTERFYGLPHYEAYGGMIYNRKLFDRNFLYFAKDGGFITSLTAERSAGPDGSYETEYDNGLPATYEEFYALCERMKLFNITPMVWSGMYAGLQSSYLYKALAADYEGKDRFALNFSFRGKADDIVTGFNAAGEPILSEQTITPEKGYYINQQAGRYYALKFMEEIIDRGFLSENSFNLTYSHTDAQEDFVKGMYENKPIGILVDGSWWEKEADTAGKFIGLPDEYSKQKSEYAYMPFPKATAGKASQKPVMVDKNYAFGIIKANVPEWKAKLAKKFMAFCYTDESLRAFTRATGFGKAMIYDMEQADLDNMTYYQKSLNEMRRQSDIIFPASTERIFMYNQNSLDFSRIVWESTVGSDTYNVVYSALKDYKVSAEDYFLGMKVSAEKWQGLYGRYF